LPLIVAKAISRVVPGILNQKRFARCPVSGLEQLHALSRAKG
jgi:hypothetical protein